MSRYEPRKLTESFVKTLPLDGIGYIVRDTKVTGLMLAVNKTVKMYAAR